MSNIKVREETNEIPPSGGRPGKFRRAVSSAIHSEWPIWLVSVSTFINGLLSVLLILIVHFPGSYLLFGWMVPFGLYHFNNSLTVGLGFLLIFLAFNLLQRRRIAWWLAVIGSGITIITNINQTNIWPAAIAPIITFSLLLIYRKRFTVSSERRSISRGLRVMIFCLLFALIYGTIGFLFLSENDFGITFGLTESIIRTLRAFTLIGNSDLVAQTNYAVWFLNSLSIIGILAYATAFYNLFRPIAYRFAVLPFENLKAEMIRNNYGRFAYDYFKVWPDKSYFFPSRNTFLAYRVEWNVAVVLGDPVGPEDELDNSIRQFMQYCRDNDWGMVFMLPEVLPAYLKNGLHLLKIGEEGMIDLENFAEKVAPKKYFRHIQNKFSRLGYSFVRYTPPLKSQILSELEEISNSWMRLPNHREYGFAQGTFDSNYLAKTPVSIVRDSGGRAVAFVNEVPSYRAGEINFDLMRHIPEVPNGTMDYIFMSLMLILKEAGYRRFDMGVAPFAGLGEKSGASLTEKAIHQLQHFDWFVHSKGIYQYKLKFEPYWEDRYVAYKGNSLALPKIALAITWAVEGRG